jgi:peptidoglycan-N-acetylglucosamine deacetylase
MRLHAPRDASAGDDGPVSIGRRWNSRVSLTFDDGPNDPYTLRIADQLDRRGVKATFFMIGRSLEARPGIARELLSRGHLVGAHSYSHGKLDVFVPGYPELERSLCVFRDTLGVKPAFYRPPYGVASPYVMAAAAIDGIQVVNFDVIVGDWMSSAAETIARRVLKRAKKGSIVVLHDGCEANPQADRGATAAAVPQILAGLARRNLDPVRLDTLLGRRGYLPDDAPERLDDTCKELDAARP